MDDRGGKLSLDGFCSRICGGSLGIILPRRAALDQFFWDVDFVGSVRFGWILALFYLVWMLNLYNVIDGIASVEAVCVSRGMSIV